MAIPLLSYSTRKSLCVHLGDDAGRELADVLQKLAQDVAELKRSKVDVTEIVPAETAVQVRAP